MSKDYYLHMFVTAQEDKLYSKITAVAEGRYPDSAAISSSHNPHGISKQVDYESALNAKFKIDSRTEWPMHYEFTPR
jgi:hypothetical protein